MEEEKPRQDMNPFIPHEEEEGEVDEASKQESPERISAVDSSAMINRKEEQEEEDSDDNSGSEFEFPSLIRDPLIPFRNPIYPVFGRPFNSSSSSSDSPLRLPLRKLLIQERNSSVGSTSTSSSTAEVADLDGVPPESYCVWSPGSAPTSPASCRKSGSTGSLTKWKKISDLVLGRSHSDGKEKFVFLSVKEKEKEKGKGKGKKGGRKATTEVDTVTAHRIFYGGSAVGNGVAGGRKSFLPYRQDLVGLFASVNGISRTHHPF